jgi:hypothetical protein
VRSPLAAALILLTPLTNQAVLLTGLVLVLLLVSKLMVTLPGEPSPEDA